MGELERYVDRHHIPADMESVRKGTGVLILHDHQIGRNRGKEIDCLLYTSEKHKYMVYKCPSFSLTDHTECFRTVNEIYINQAVKAAPVSYTHLSQDPVCSPSAPSIPILDSVKEIRRFLERKKQVSLCIGKYLR